MKDYILNLLRIDFDSKRNQETAKKSIDAAIYVAGKDDIIVQEMIADFEFEFNVEFNNL